MESLAVEVIRTLLSIVHEKLDTHEKLDRIHEKLNLILEKLDKIEKQETKLMADDVTLQQAVSDLTAEVAQDTTVDAASLTLINKLLDQVSQANSTSPAAVEALVAQLRAGREPLAAAVAQNTVADVAPQAGTSVPSTQA